jgi:hypothetical protein
LCGLLRACDFLRNLSIADWFVDDGASGKFL